MPTSSTLPTKTVPWQLTCGPYALWQTIDQSINSFSDRHQFLVVYDIGLIGPIPNILNTNAIVCSPGQGVALAVGAITTNPSLKVIVVSTMQNQYKIGIRTLIEAAADNHNITIIVSNPSDSTVPSNQLGQLLSSGASYLAKGFLGSQNQLQELVIGAIKHDGLAVVDVLVPSCQNAQTSYAGLRPRIFALQDNHHPASSNWPATDKAKAWQMAQNTQRIDTGLLYRSNQPSYQSVLQKKLSRPATDQSKKPSIKSLMTLFK